MEQRYFNELEKKERLEDKLQSVKELKVKVVSCSKVSGNVSCIVQKAEIRCNQEKLQMNSRL